jgi:tRNA-dihydrouridine synthase
MPDLTTTYLGLALRNPLVASASPLSKKVDVVRGLEDAGAAAVAVHGRTAAQSYTGESDWSLIGRVAESVTIPVFGSGDCVHPDQVIARLRETGAAGVLVGRGARRNPWIFSQAAARADGAARADEVALEERGRFLLDYIDLLIRERVGEDEGFRHVAPGIEADSTRPARGRERWVVNKVRALGAWYTKGLDGGAQLRVAINAAENVESLRELIREFFGVRDLEACIL